MTGDFVDSLALLQFTLHFGLLRNIMISIHIFGAHYTSQTSNCGDDSEALFSIDLHLIK